MWTLPTQYFELSSGFSGYFIIGDTENCMGHMGSNFRQHLGVVVTLNHKVHKILSSPQLVWVK